MKAFGSTYYFPMRRYTSERKSGSFLLKVVLRHLVRSLLFYLFAFNFVEHFVVKRSPGKPVEKSLKNTHFEALLTSNLFSNLTHIPNI